MELILGEFSKIFTYVFLGKTHPKIKVTKQTKMVSFLFIGACLCINIYLIHNGCDQYSISTWNDCELFSEAKSNDIIQNQFLKKNIISKSL